MWLNKYEIASGYILEVQSSGFIEQKTYDPIGYENQARMNCLNGEGKSKKAMWTKGEDDFLSNRNEGFWSIDERILLVYNYSQSFSFFMGDFGE